MQTLVPIAATAQVEKWQVTFLGGQDIGVIALVGVVAAALVIWTHRSLDPMFSRGRRAAIVLLRTGALLSAIAMLLQPSIHFRTLENVPSRFAVLVDVSDSMTRGAPNHRLDSAKKMFERVAKKMETLVPGGKLVLYRFADSLASAGGIDEAFTPFETPVLGTDIKSAVMELIRGQGKTPLSGIAIVSDGGDTELSLTDGKSPDFGWVKEAGVPINTIFVPARGESKDLAIAGVEVNPFAFSRSETPIIVTVKSTDRQDHEVEVLLWQSGALVQRKEVELKGGEGRLTFSLFPKRLGPHVFKITVPVLKDDRLKENNEAYVSFDVIRDKFRVLHVAGSPSWDQRFLRETLDSWPKVDLVSFYVLRTAYQSRTLGSSGMTLIPFPTENVFKTHLKEFDVVIFQNFEPHSVGVDEYLDRIAQFVKEGGAFALVGGNEGLKGGSLATGALEEILPAKMLNPQTASLGLVDGVPFKPRLTESGMRHPLTQISKKSGKRETRWNTLRRLDGINRVASLAEGALCLAEHPFLKADDGLSPVIAVKETGEGRSLLVATDSLWRWRFSGPMEGGDPVAYTEFWKQSILWLTRSPKLESLRVKVSPSPAIEGSPIGIDIELLDESYKPVPRATIKGLFRWSRSDGSEKTEKFGATLDDHGRYHFEWKPKSGGPHLIEIAASTGGTSRTQFLVTNRNREIQHQDGNQDLLKAISSESSGAFLNGNMDPKKWRVTDAPTKRLLSQADQSLWDHPLAIVFVLLFLSGEWILRRKTGLT